jgi:O-antigen/teichoic acid export membrane protein
MTTLFILNIGLNVALNIPLIIYYGAVWASFATMIAGLISGIIGLVVSQHYYKIYYEWNKIAWIMGTFMIASLIIAIIYIMQLPYMLSFSIEILALVIFINLGVRYGIIYKKNFREVKSAIRFRRVIKA